MTDPSARTPHLTEPVSAAELLAPPRYSGASISPNGRRIAFLASWQGRLNVWVVDVPSGGPLEVDLASARRVTADADRPILDYRWTDDPDVLLYLQDTDGDENHHVFRVDLDAAPGKESSPAVDLTPYPGSRVWRLHEVPGLTGAIVVEINHRAPECIDLAEIDVATGELTVLAEGRGDATSWLPTATRDVYAIASTEAGWELAQHRPDGTRRVVTTWCGDEHPLGPAPCEPTPDGTGLWIGSYHGDDRLRLTHVDLATGEETEVDSHPAFDVDTRAAVFPLLPSPLIRDRATGALLAVRYSRERQDVRALDPRFADVLARLEALSDGDLGALSSDSGGRYWIAAFVHDRDPGVTWLYDHATGDARLLFRPWPDLDPKRLVPMHPVTITARDGLDLPSYLTLPHTHDGQAPPLILMPHGGPWVRDAWGFSAIAQYFAARGYAVLAPNFRGSTGFGRAHVLAAIGEFARAMHDDLVDAVEWAVTNGHADPARVAIFGGSYGGYAALVGVTFTPDLFAAAVDYVGVSNLANFMRTIPPALRPGLRHNFHRYVGDPDVPEQEADMLARSPITHLDRVTTPLMVFQGANDVRVVQSESDAVVEHLRARDVEVGYRVFADEGHRFAKTENLVEMIETTGRFLATHLGGRP
ncbi:MULTISPECIES: S9 family peptidase [unclassified Saccharopolyspora]|uniref:alpha/beta hydrolase family protein n=1 Tax=unclassified Saccharopolyspora TaxID=2646250 RepID=UPI001CD38EE4|nr:MULTISPECIES: S9 family peptidase [unclassified Saccharopolyspora]MCA1186207.1 S9 family peptidase [Saccharopolyspora sp. 6T]MCA1278410.1 S9 family peptidase [Saccharopolyspora sp. 7B]